MNINIMSYCTKILHLSLELCPMVGPQPNLHDLQEQNHFAFPAILPCTFIELIANVKGPWAMERTEGAGYHQRPS